MYLIDTNIASEWNKGRRINPGVQAFTERAAKDKHPLLLSVITVGELRRGIDQIRLRGDAPQADRLEAWFAGLLAAYEDRVLPLDAEVTQLWGRLRAVNPHNALDKLIAATALLYDLTVVTRNERDFAATGARVMNPFS